MGLRAGSKWERVQQQSGKDWRCPGGRGKAADLTGGQAHSSAEYVLDLNLHLQMINK